MRAFAFAASLLVLGSFGAAAQQATPLPSPELNLNPRDVAAIGVGSLLGFFVAEPLGVSELIGVVAGTTIGAWWYADHADAMQRPEIRPTAAREPVPPNGGRPSLVLAR